MYLIHARYLFFLILCSSYLDAAAPVVHAYLSELYFEQCKPTYTTQEKDSFMRGTLFPDIRYIARIPRSRTHRKNVTLDSVVNEPDPFTAGLLFHTYVDEQREKIAQAYGIYSHLKEVPAKDKGHFLKSVEDELCYNKINPSTLRITLKKFDRQESTYKVSALTRMTWHRLLSNYFKQSPLALFRHKTETRSGYLHIPAERIAKYYALMKKYYKDPKIMAYVTHLVSEFKELLTKDFNKKAK